MLKPRLIVVSLVLIQTAYATPSVVLADSAQQVPEQKGLETQLVPLGSEYVLGKPMKLRVQLANRSPSPLPYNPYATAYDYDGNSGPLAVIGPDGKRQPYLGDWMMHQDMIGGRSPTLEPGAVVTLFECDLADYYYIGAPGHYSVQYRSLDTPSSNTLEIDIKPGNLSVVDAVVGRLLHSFSSWSVVKMDPGRSGPKELEAARAAIAVYKDPLHFHSTFGMTVWVTDEPVDLSRLQGSSWEGIEYLGRSPWGHVYARIPNKRYYSYFRAPEKEKPLPDIRGLRGLLREALELQK